MATKRIAVPELQRQLLMAGVKSPGGKLRFDSVCSTIADAGSTARCKNFDAVLQHMEGNHDWNII